MGDISSRQPGELRHREAFRQHVPQVQVRQISTSFSERHLAPIMGSAMYGGSLGCLVINSTLYTKMTSMQVQNRHRLLSVFSVSFPLITGRTCRQRCFQRLSAKYASGTVCLWRQLLLLKEGNYSKWAASVPSNPAPINANTGIKPV